MKLTPPRFFVTTALLAAAGGWLGYRHASQTAAASSFPAASASARHLVPTAPPASTSGAAPQTPADLEALVHRYLDAADSDAPLAATLRRQLLTASEILLHQTWENLAAHRPDQESDSSTGDTRSTLLSILCERDVLGTIQWLTRAAPPDELGNLLQIMLGSWSADNPAAAWAGMMAATSEPAIESEAKGNALATICRNYAQRDPTAAFAAILALPADHWLPDDAAEILCREAATPERRMAMLDQLVRKPPGRLRTAGLKAILEFQAQNQPLSQVGGWIQSQPLPDEEKDTLLASVAAATAPDDPRAALDWLLAHARPEAAAQSLNMLTRQWADASPNDCAGWLRTLPPGPTTDAALIGFVDEVRDHDPESAFQWTRRFNNPEQRRTFAISTWEKWRTLAPVSATRFASQLEPQERAWLKLDGAP